MLSDRAASAILILVLLAVGAASFLVIFGQYLAAVPAGNYAARDDALITLSHARNLVEYGFIGVAPSGERIEGFSAPLQFWIAAGLYRIAPYSYEAFFQWQTSIGTAGLGALAAALLCRPFDKRHWGRVALVVVALPLVAWTLATSPAFLLWHASGMENVYKVTLLAALLLALDNMLRAGRIAWWPVPVVFLAAITRIDAILPVSLLLVAFVVLWWLRHRNVAAIRFVAVALLPWIAYMLWRTWYFGQWQPNTAIGQSISVTARLSQLINAPATTFDEHWRWLTSTSRALHAFQLAWLPILVVLARREPTALSRIVLLITAVGAVLLQFTLFGPSRMDPDRTVTELAFYSALAVPFVMAGITRLEKQTVAFAVAMMTISALVASARELDRREIGWGVADWAAAAFEALAREHQVPRPLVSNPDLGGVSWPKQFNIVDSGLLASAIMPRVERPAAYLVEVAKPDFIEMHAAWSCRYNALFSNETFAREYVELRSARTAWLDEHCAIAPAARDGLWIRRAITRNSATPERSFIDAFQSDLTSTRVSAELDTCRRVGNPATCDYVARTVFRFVPELKANGAFAEVAELLNESSDVTGAALFSSSVDSGWWRRAIEAFDPVNVSPERLSLFTLLDASKASSAAVSVRDPQQFGWRIEVEAPELVSIEPTRGVGFATLVVRPRPTQQAIDRIITLRVFGGRRLDPAREVRLRFRSMEASAGQPFGSIDTQPKTLALDDNGLVLRGWALDGFDLQRVRVYVERDGLLEPIGDAQRSGERPDLSKLFPNAYDLFNATWAFHVTRLVIKDRSRPITFHIFAEASDGRVTDLGTRVIR